MKLLDQVVGILNNRLKTTVLKENVFSGGNFFGLAYTTQDPDNPILRPYVWDNNNILDASIDDSYPFNIYHKCNSISFKDGVQIQSWGDGDSRFQMICEMNAIVFADREKTNYSQEDLIMKISSGLNYTFTVNDLMGGGIDKIKSTTLRANNNSLSVFQGEYGSNTNYPLQISSVYFGITYQLEITADINCLQCQNC